MGTISSFRGKYEFLSNFYESVVLFEGLLYPTAENAFQAAKVKIEGDIEKTNKLRYDKGFTKLTPSMAKSAGRKVKLREDWEEVKEDIMYNILYDKFTNNEGLKGLLLKTAPDDLVEGNYWHDNYWGVCSCTRCISKEKKNKLGKILMEVRKNL